MVLRARQIIHLLIFLAITYYGQPKITPAKQKQLFTAIRYSFNTQLTSSQFTVACKTAAMWPESKALYSIDTLVLFRRQRKLCSLQRAPAPALAPAMALPQPQTQPVTTLADGLLALGPSPLQSLLSVPGLCLHLFLWATVSDSLCTMMVLPPPEPSENHNSATDYTRSSIGQITDKHFESIKTLTKRTLSNEK